MSPKGGQVRRHSDEQSQASDPRQDEVSKTRRKAQMHALQDLGEALVALDPARLAQIDLPERLADAVAEARSIRAHEGRRRQMQFIGKLMRDIDPVPVREAIERFAAGVPSDRAGFAAAERWREEMLRDDEAVTRFAAEHPGADAAALSSLVRDARAERTRGGPPHRYRELFRRIRELQ
jgi:ribosome-associated protein